MRYQGKSAVIIGRTHGMSLAKANLLLAGGAKVLITGRNPANIETARKTLGDQVHAVQSDASGMNDITLLGAIVGQRLGQIDFLRQRWSRRTGAVRKGDGSIL